MFNKASLQVADDTPIDLQMDREKWERFLAAAEEMGRAPETLLAESIDLCMDTAIAMAIHRKRE